MDVYFVQSRMCRNWGYEKLYERLAQEISDETRHADALIKRILFLEGTPDLAKRSKFSVGKTVEEMLTRDLVLEHEVARQLNEVIAHCVSIGDNGSRKILDELLEDTEHDHILWLESQLHQIAEIGFTTWLQAQI